MTPEEAVAMQSKMVHSAWREESFPRRLLAGRNWAYRRSGVGIVFDGHEMKKYPIEPNDPDTDSCIEWMDGFVSVLRTDHEQSFSDSPPQLGKARVGIGTKARRTDGKKKRKH